jgi:hypothetical protein
MVVKRYGKSSASLLLQKSSFFEENEKHLARQRKIAELYRRQPHREYCKNCNDTLGSNIDFIKGGIGYKLCVRCGHLNGEFQDTDDFCTNVYSDDGGIEYATNYSSKDFDSFNYRVASIYLPKAEFLYSSLLANKVDPNSLSYSDFGAGTGYFISALKKTGLDKITGYEVSPAQVKAANSMLGEDLVVHNTLHELLDVAERTTTQVVSMIGVLEHMRHPRDLLMRLKRNTHVKYLFLAVPLFSPSVYFELSFPKVFHRQLSEDHTHLYTEESLDYMCSQFGYKSIAEWWFGTDIVDLYRSICVTMEQEGHSKKVVNIWKQKLFPIIDAMQLEIDENHLSSDVHILLEKTEISI